jgi:hypothetical protein
MNLFKKILFSFLNSAAVMIYITSVALIMQNAEKLFGKMKDTLGPVAFLLLFVISAAIVSTLVFGWPIYLFSNNEKREAIIRLGLNLGWLFVFTAIVFLILIF